MVTVHELLNLQVFSELPEDQLTWFISVSEEVVLKPSDTYVHEDDPADKMFVVLEGQLEARADFNGDVIVIGWKVGDVTGALPFSRMKVASVTGRAITDSRILRFPSAKFPDLITKMPELTKRLVGLMSDRIREVTRIEQQRDRLAALGKLSAGLAHELNNPASAAKRATSQLRLILKKIKEASHDLGKRELTSAQKSDIDKLESLFTQKDGHPPDALTVNTLEDEIDTLLRGHGLNDMWQLASDLAHRGVQPETLQSLFASLDSETAKAALVRIAASVEIADLLNELESSTSRISDLVLAIKEYTYMDQSPVQNVDIVKSLETTLTILNHKLKRGVTVKRDYQKIPLVVNSFGSELNQVWTNLIDNAIDAMDGKGELSIHVYRDNDGVQVEIGDSGPGIPEETKAHIFEPFFTTKGVGQGTGLGLDTVQRIVRKHRGIIQVTSKPGDTCFRVWIPVSGNPEATSHA